VLREMSPSPMHVGQIGIGIGDGIRIDSGDV
jgi:hypothetical protein